MATLKDRITADPVITGEVRSIGDVVAGDHGIAVVSETYESARGGNRARVAGIAELPKSTDSAFGLLERVFWNTTRERCVAADDAGNQAGEILVPCGLCAEAAASDDTTCEVLLNAGGAPSVEVT